MPPALDIAVADLSLGQGDLPVAADIEQGVDPSTAAGQADRVPGELEVHRTLIRRLVLWTEGYPLQIGRVGHGHGGAPHRGPAPAHRASSVRRRLLWPSGRASMRLHLPDFFESCGSISEEDCTPKSTRGAAADVAVGTALLEFSQGATEVSV